MPQLNLNSFCSLLSLFAPTKPLLPETNEIVENQHSNTRIFWVVTVLVLYSH